MNLLHNPDSCRNHHRGHVVGSAPENTAHLPPTNRTAAALFCQFGPESASLSSCPYIPTGRLLDRLEHWSTTMQPTSAPLIFLARFPPCDVPVCGCDSTKTERLGVPCDHQSG